VIAVTLRSYQAAIYPKSLERLAIQGDSPVGERSRPPDMFPSTAGHVEPGANLEGPPSKAKYSHATDSVIVARVKGEKHPCKGSEIVPETAERK
jgi:hypothetical protein